MSTSSVFSGRILSVLSRYSIPLFEHPQVVLKNRMSIIVRKVKGDNTDYKLKINKKNNTTVVDFVLACKLHILHGSEGERERTSKTRKKSYHEEF